MALWHKVAGTWKNIVPYNRVSATWKNLTVWNKVGVAWKIITALFSPPGGNISVSGIGGQSQILTCTVAATWTYALRGGGSPGGSVNQASGYVGTSIQFSQSAGGGSGTIRTNIWDVTGAVSGYPNEIFVVQLDAEAP